MLTGININETHRFISKYDPDKQNPTVFHIGFMDSFLRGWIEDKSTSIEFSAGGPDEQARGNVMMKKRSIMLVQYGVRNIEAFIDPNAKEPIKVSLGQSSISGKGYPVLPDKIVAMIPMQIIDELADEVVRIQDLSGAETKN